MRLVVASNSGRGIFPGMFSVAGESKLDLLQHQERTGGSRRSWWSYAGWSSIEIAVNHFKLISSGSFAVHSGAVRKRTTLQLDNCLFLKVAEFRRQEAASRLRRQQPDHRYGEGEETQSLASCQAAPPGGLSIFP